MRPLHAFNVHLGDFNTPAPVEDYIYVDDTSSCLASSDPFDSHLQKAADYARVWADTNDMQINAEKTKELLFSFSKKHHEIQPIRIGETVIEQVATSKLLGVTLSANLTWTSHVESLISKCTERLYLLFYLERAGVTQSDLVILYKSMIRSLT